MEGAMAWTLGDIRLDPAVNQDTQYREGSGIHWFLTEEEGFWGAPENDASRTQKFNQHGVTIGPGWKKERTVSLKGHAFAPTFADLRRAANQLTALLNDPYEGALLICHSEIGDLSCEVFLDGAILTEPYTAATPAFTWSIQVVAPDPRKYNPQEITLATGLPSDAPNDGLNFEAGSVPNKGLDFGLPDSGLMFGMSAQSSGMLQLQNWGTAPTTPVFTLTGPLTNPVLTANADGGPYTMQFNGSLAAGEMLVIDPSAPSVLLGGTASRRHLLSPANFRGFTIPGSRSGDNPGVLSVGLTHTGSSNSIGTVSATYRSAWF